MRVNYFRYLIGSLSVGSTLLLFSCDIFEKEEAPEPMATLQFEFRHKVNSAPLEFGEMKYTDAAGNKYSITRLEYYISGFYFSGMGDKAGDTILQIDSVFYINGEKESTHIHTVEGLPESHLHMGYFTLGLLPEKNRTDFLTDNPMNAGMVWPENMGGGYHFLKLEGKFMDGDMEKVYKLHLGTLVNNSGTYHAHFQVDSLLLHAQPVAGHTLLIPIIMNVENWLDNPNVFDLSETPMTMMNPTAQGILMDNARQDGFEPGEVSIIN